MTNSTPTTYRSHLDQVMAEQGRMNIWLARVCGVEKGTVTRWRKAEFAPDQAKQALITRALGQEIQFRQEA